MQLYGLQIEEHLRRIDELSDKLAAIGEEVFPQSSVQESYPTRSLGKRR